MVPFMCVWSGAAIGGIYGSQIASGKFNPMMSAVGIPFLLASLIFWSWAAMCVCGKVEIVLRDHGGTVFTGVGSLGWKRRFSLSEFTSVREGDYGPSGRGGRARAIALEGSRRLVFGSLLNEARRYFVVESLRALLDARV